MVRKHATSGWATSTGGGNCASSNSCGVIEGNPDLDPETSVTEEIALLWSGQGGYSAGVTLFNNDFKDKIENFNTGVRNADGFFIWRNENIGEANQRGVELAFAAPWVTTSCWMATTPIRGRRSRRRLRGILSWKVSR